MLTNEQILPACYYWARVFSNKHHSFDELVNEAYVHAKQLDSPLLLNKWVKFTMLAATKSTHTSARLGRRKKKDITSTLKDDEIQQAFDGIEDKSFNFSNFIEMQEEMMGIIDSVCSEGEKELIHARFWLNMSYEEIAVELGVVFQTIYFRVKKALEKIRNEYRRRADL